MPQTSRASGWLITRGRVNNLFPHLPKFNLDLCKCNDNLENEVPFLEVSRSLLIRYSLSFLFFFSELVIAILGNWEPNRIL